MWAFGDVRVERVLECKWSSRLNIQPPVQFVFGTCTCAHPSRSLQFPTGWLKTPIVLEATTHCCYDNLSLYTIYHKYVKNGFSRWRQPLSISDSLRQHAYMPGDVLGSTYFCKCNYLGSSFDALLSAPKAPVPGYLNHLWNTSALFSFTFYTYDGCDVLKAQTSIAQCCCLVMMSMYVHQNFRGTKNSSILIISRSSV